MSFLFGGGTKGLPAAGQKPMGSDFHRASTSESARPVPVIVGKQRIGLTFITDVFKERAAAVTQTIGKQKTKAGYNYYASFAAVACIGRVDALHDVFLNGDSVYADTTVITALTLTNVGTLATFTTRNAHGLTTGDVVLVEGANELAFNGSHTITVTSPTTFTFVCIEVPSATPATGTITARLKLDPVFRDIDHPDYVDIVIPDFGEMRLYWGTESQAADAYLQTSNVRHPAYRGVCYAVFRELFLGFNQTNVQNVELTVAKYPKADWHDIDEIDGDANAVAFIGDILQNPRGGLALPTARLDTVTLLDTADKIETEGLGFSPLLMRKTEGRQVLVQAMEYLDAYPTVSADGKLAIALARKPTGDLLEIVDADLTARPTFSQDDWSAAHSETNVKFTNREFDFKEDAPPPWRDPGTRDIIGEPSPLNLDRSWVTNPTVAEAMVKSAGRAAALPPLNGSLKLRKRGTMFTDLVPGVMFTLNVTGRDCSNLIFRVIERNWPDAMKPEFTVSFKLDRSYLYIPPA